MVLSGTIIAIAQEKPTVYINCATVNTRCHRDYLFQTITNCAFVWDAEHADVQVLITEKPNSTGGVRVTQEFTGMKSLAGRKDTLWFDATVGQTDEFIRTRMAETIQQGLLFQFRGTSWQHLFKVQQAKIDTMASSSLPKKDKWNYWNFTPGVQGYVEGQSNSFFIEVGGTFTAQRITPKHKFIVNSKYETKHSSIDLKDESISMSIRRYAILPLYARSISEHWSIGVTGQLETNEYANISSSYRVAQLVEYNIFPYRINAQKQLRFVYQLGVQHFIYYDSTIHNSLKETKPYHRVSIITDITRNWGSVRNSLQYNAYLDNMDQDRITFSSLMSIRVAKGLFFFIEGQFDIVHDQISLLKNDLDDNVYILGGQQLPTKSYFWAEFGINFNFGSRFNSIVNPRMGQIDELGF